MNGARRRLRGAPARGLCGVAAVMLAGCAGAVLGGAATGAVVAVDPRTTGTVIEDQAIELKAASTLHDDPGIREQTHIGVTSYNQAVLLTGQAPTAALRARAVALVSDIDKVRHVYDEIAIAAPTALTTRTGDGLLTTKVKTRLFADEHVDAARIKVVTEDGVVYLMGLVAPEQGTIAAREASEIRGVKKVVKLFEAP